MLRPLPNKPLKLTVACGARSLSACRWADGEDARDMIGGRFALVLLVLFGAACAGRSVPYANPSVESWGISPELQACEDKDYEGGLTREDIKLAQVLAERAFSAGVIRKECPRSDGARGGVVATGENSDLLGTEAQNPVIEFLSRVIREGNRKQRDIALAAIARIGPGASLDPQFFQDRGGWSRDALTSVTCEKWSPPDVHAIWSPERQVSVSNLPYRERPALAVDLMIGQMLDKGRVWPGEVFSHSLFNRGYSQGITQDRVRKLIPILVDSEYPVSIRTEAVRFISELGRNAQRGGAPYDVRIFEGALFDLYRLGPVELSAAAASALVQLRSHLGSDVLVDWVESDRARSGPRQWRPSQDCWYPPGTDPLVRSLLKRMEDGILDVRIAAIEAIGCLREKSAVPQLIRALEDPFWSQQRAAVVALGRIDPLPPEGVSAIQKIAQLHWSAIVRQAARRSIDAVKGEKPDKATDTTLLFERGFHRRAIKHGLPICHGEQPGDGTYALPWLGSFRVHWEEAKVHDIPVGFPITLREMRSRTGYGTNTFLRTEGGWLFSVDLWHYDGDFGYVSDIGEVQRFAPEAAHAAFIIETQFGRTVLGEDAFDGGDGGILAVVDRKRDGEWSYRVLLELPSEAYAYALAPDGTLLIKDPYGAVAITKDRTLVPLSCS